MGAKRLWNNIVGNKIIVIILLVFLFPVGLYCMWKGEHFSPAARWIITAFLLWWAWNLLADSPSTGTAPDCASVFKSGGCTYYRDSSCKVISRVCE